MCVKTGYKKPASKRLQQLVRRIASPVTKRLQLVMTCGLTSRKLVLTLCVGSAIGVMPLVWGTTLICILLAQRLKLNHAALQSVNYLLYPIQLALLAPFFKFGAWLFPGGPKIPPDILFSLIRSQGLSSLNIIVWITLKSVAAWLVTALPAALLIYGIVRRIPPRNKALPA